jgi:hypothetical protein
MLVKHVLLLWCYHCVTIMLLLLVKDVFLLCCYCYSIVGRVCACCVVITLLLVMHVLLCYCCHSIDGQVCVVILMLVRYVMILLLLKGNTSKTSLLTHTWDDKEEQDHEGTPKTTNHLHTQKKTKGSKIIVKKKKQRWRILGGGGGWTLTFDVLWSSLIDSNVNLKWK